MFSFNRSRKILHKIIYVAQEQHCNASIQPKVISSTQNFIISSKRKSYNMHKDQTYNKFDEIPLVSKGWNHSKSKGDYFIIHSDMEEYDKPINSFHDINVHPKLIEALQTMEITHATHIQSKTIPQIRSGQNVYLTAETGCGKTIAYLIPIIENIIGKRSQNLNTPSALVLVPNRELANQIGEVAQQLGSPVGLKVKVIVGGRTKQKMMNPEFGDIDILIGTPGAISKLSTVGIYKLNDVQYTVLDEADTLSDDSFVERLEILLRRVPQSQLTLVSATALRSFPAVLEAYKQSMVTITSERLHKPLMTITQRFLRLTKSVKPSQLLLIAKQNKQPLIAFSNRNETCRWLAMFLRENNISCSNINGDMNQAIRIEQWNQFVSGKTNILSATDIGSRGLDTRNVRHVLNYDFPLYTADYIHRIGRTGRLSSPDACKVTNFISGSEEVSLVQQIEVSYSLFIYFLYYKQRFFF